MIVLTITYLEFLSIRVVWTPLAWLNDIRSTCLNDNLIQIGGNIYSFLEFQTGSLHLVKLANQSLVTKGLCYLCSRQADRHTDGRPIAGSKRTLIKHRGWVVIVLIIFHLEIGVARVNFTVIIVMVRYLVVVTVLPVLVKEQCLLAMGKEVNISDYRPSNSLGLLNTDGQARLTINLQEVVKHIGIFLRIKDISSRNTTLRINIVTATHSSQRSNRQTLKRSTYHISVIIQQLTLNDKIGNAIVGRTCVSVIIQCLCRKLIESIRQIRN